MKKIFIYLILIIALLILILFKEKIIVFERAAVELGLAEQRTYHFASIKSLVSTQDEPLTLHKNERNSAALSRTITASRIIDCESEWNKNAIGKAGEIGLAQFKPKTFDWMCELSGKDLDIHNPQDQIELLLWALENGYERHWTCFHKIQVLKN